jgi:hypothetical protein
MNLRHLTPPRVCDAFENTSDEVDQILGDAYWEFQDDNKSPDLKWP